MIADMHCHFPMHLLAEDPPERWPVSGEVSPSVTFEAMTDVRRRPGWLNKLRAAALRCAAAKLNYREDEWRVSLDGLLGGDVRGVFSVLYEPFAEIDLDELPGAAPQPGYFEALTDQIALVQARLSAQDPGNAKHTVVTDAAALDATIAAGKVAFMHCVEGGFHIGPELGLVDERVAELAGLGVVYITVSHLFWRGVAGNAPAIPFLSDAAYNRIFFLWSRRGLTPLGAKLIEAMYRHDVMVDVSHMNQHALDDTFALLEKLDRDTGNDPRDHPVIATHAGFRFGSQAYMLSPQTIGRIAARGGVIGLILAQHQLNECAGVADQSDPAETPGTLRRHIDAIRRHTPDRSNDHVAIGSDLDGFIKPTVAGIETVADLATLVEPLEAAYGEEEAAKILSGNALGVVRRVLARRG